MYNMKYKIVSIIAMLMILTIPMMGTSARNVPLFAVNAAGEPVQNLLKGQLELLVDGKLKEFHLLNLNSTAVSRVVFVMIESRFSSDLQLQRTRAVLKEMIAGIFPKDSFVIMRGSLQQGVRIVLGPENRRSKLLAYVERMKMSADRQPAGMSGETYRLAAQRWFRSLTRLKYIMHTMNGSKLFFLLSAGLNGETSLAASGASAKVSSRDGADNKNLSDPNIYDKSQYKSKTEELSAAARSIKEKKTGKGFPDTPFFLDFIVPFCTSVNAGGSVLHVINPRVPGGGMDKSLRVLARHGGGRYFEAKETVSIVGAVQNTAAGYYQLAFTQTKEVAVDLKKERRTPDLPEPGQEIQVRCKRKDVTLFNLQYLEGKTGYAKFGKIDKQLFATDVLTQGAWSRMSGSFKKVLAYRLPDTKKGKDNILTLEIPIPPAMMSRKVDVFTVLSNSNGRVVQINRAKRLLTDRERISTKFKAGKMSASDPLNYSIVMIDPNTMLGIYGIEAAAARSSTSNRKSDDVGSVAAMSREDRPKVDAPAANQDALPEILKKTAVYCKQLEKEVFHFFCIEKVYEQFAVYAYSDHFKNKSVNNFLSKGNRWGSAQGRVLRERSRFYDQTRPLRKYKREYLYNYQIIKADDKIKELRELFKFNKRKLKKGQKPKNQAILYSYKNAIYPVLLFSKNRQSVFNYSLLGKSRLMKRNTYVIEIKSKPTGSQPAKLLAISWVDDTDFSILKFQVFSAAFKGYTYLIRSGTEGMKEIKIKDVHYFGQVKNGLRFPSKTNIKISYKRKAKKNDEFKRSSSKEIDYLIKLETVISYKKYLFYKVKVDDPIYTD